MRQNATKSYDLPRQIPNTQVQDLEKLERKRQELLNWEDGLIQKSRQMEEAVEQFNVKMSKMASQKAEIQGNVKKLQGLTVDYSRMLESEGRAKEMQD